ncbi:MAG TPA: DUF5698 domain-containing protein [Gemmatales bacterium]|nr:DUF5698 domain-containing protein [Gemmatales bacterium]HMP58276.1 DUF5698 domain-containing protein [Gemmatales bacterium]
MFGLAILIFLAETSVVTLDTVRIIFVSRGFKFLSMIIGLVVVSIWLFAIGQIMKNLDSIECFVAYAAGYVLGVYLGITIEERLAIGTQLIRIITNKNAEPLIRKLRATMHGVTYVQANGATGPVHLIFTIVQRKQVEGVVALIQSFDPQTFYTIEDVRKQQAGVFPGRMNRPAGETFGVPADAAQQLLPLTSKASA